MGGGAAFLDVDNDGDRGSALRERPAVAVGAAPPPRPAARAIRRSRSIATTVAATSAMRAPKSGFAQSFYGMGVAAGDYDNDGWVDVFVTAVGAEPAVSQRRRPISRTSPPSAGVGGPADAWSTCAAWIDVDNDGDLDLFVCHYVRWSRAIDLAQDFRLTGIGRAYGPPRTFEGAFPVALSQRRERPLHRRVRGRRRAGEERLDRRAAREIARRRADRPRRRRLDRSRRRQRHGAEPRVSQPA